ncbi:hypothetical protein [Corynebacterium terpenotabidum]|uniref:Uncharacterized protein n=1 Tax=Corynebacterium terpenotabidum Y-11 TaxID=1200352 RepID=S4XEF4_9CORY|nr:hypothetical protein [Corynebacterium terpenotabidum]AGP29970.1 hypothetical protein A606_01575 [Corynebacterium terpenotabidum Y-11]
MSFGFLFFLPTPDTGTPDGYLPDNALLSLAHAHMNELERSDVGVFDSWDEAVASAPAQIVDLAGWVNHHADLGAHDPNLPPAFRFLQISEFPVTPHHGVLHIEVPFSAGEETGRHFQFKAAELGVCMVDDMEQVWVNPTGGDSGLRMRDSVDTVTTHVDRASILAVLGEDVDRRRRADRGIPFVVVEVNGDDSSSPVTGVRYVQAALTGAGWIVEYRTSNRHFRLDQQVLDDANALGYISQVLGEYAAGEDAAFFAHRWEDVSAELIV